MHHYQDLRTACLEMNGTTFQTHPIRGLRFSSDRRAGNQHKVRHSDQTSHLFPVVLAQTYQHLDQQTVEGISLVQVALGLGQVHTRMAHLRRLPYIQARRAVSLSFFSGYPTVITNIARTISPAKQLRSRHEQHGRSIAPITPREAAIYRISLRADDLCRPTIHPFSRDIFDFCATYARYVYRGVTLIFNSYSWH